MEIDHLLTLLKGDHLDIETAFGLLEKHKRYVATINRYRAARRAYLINLIDHEEWLRQQQAAINEVLLPSEEAKNLYFDALVLVRNHENQRAIEVFTAAIDRFAEYGEAFLGRAIARQNEWLRHGIAADLHAAVWDLNKALDIGIDNADNAFWNLAVAYLRSDDRRSALKYLKKIKTPEAFPDYPRLKAAIRSIPM